MLAVPDFLQDTFLLDLLLELTHGRFEGFPFTNLDLWQCNQLLSDYMVFEQSNITLIHRDVNKN
jgi:hypothetical protein